MYTVFVDDNFHYMEESERYKQGEYETYEEARKVCQSIVERSLLACSKKKAGTEDMYLNYEMFGDDPFIVPSPEGKRFSAREYAKQLCYGDSQG